MSAVAIHTQMATAALSNSSNSPAMATASLALTVFDDQGNLKTDPM